jgi:hypothetical protein
LRGSAGLPQFPDRGALRVHPAPDKLPAPRRGEEPGLNRFDDPNNEFVVRYLGETLRGCLLETMSRFRASRRAEELLNAVQGLEPGEERPDIDPERGLADWLSKQRIGRCHLASSFTLVSVNDPALLAELDLEPRVRDALRGIGLEELDEAVIRLGGKETGRKVTQVVSRILWEGDVAGLAYSSRHDDNEQCWAIYGTTPVWFDEQMLRLDPENAEHAEAVADVAALFHIQLPTKWRGFY